MPRHSAKFHLILDFFNNVRSLACNSHDPPALTLVPSAPIQISWSQQLRARTAVQPWLKTLSISVFVVAFFAAYFRLLNYPVHPITVMPLIAIDRLIGFQPIAIL